MLSNMHCSLIQLSANKKFILGFEKFRNDIKTFESKLSKLKEGCSKK